MEAIFAKMLGAVKYTKKLFVIVAIISGVLLFSPSFFISQMGLTQVTSDYNTYIGFAFLISGVVSVVDFILFIYSKSVNKIKLKKISKSRINRLKMLNPREKEILLYYFVNHTNTQPLRVNDGTVAELEFYEIISRTSQISQGWFEFPYNLNPWAREYLSEHPGLLNFTREEEAILKQLNERELWPL